MDDVAAIDAAVAGAAASRDVVRPAANAVAKQRARPAFAVALLLLRRSVWIVGHRSPGMESLRE
jgi:hypothetical protein